MEPLDDRQLKQLLQRWEAPAAPPGLREKLTPPPLRQWRWFLTGSIRIPVPVGLAAIVAFVVWMLAGRTPPAPAPQPGASISLADFQPVRQLEPKIITTDENSNESHQSNEQQYK
jgi:hypothetical protein